MKITQEKQDSFNINLSFKEYKLLGCLMAYCSASGKDFNKLYGKEGSELTDFSTKLETDMFVFIHRG